MLGLKTTPSLKGILNDLEIPEFCFTPDEWNLAFLKGLLKVDFVGKRILELGVGAGVNIVGLAKYHCNFLPTSIMLSDIDARNVDVAVGNIKKCICESIVFPLQGSYDLFNRIDIDCPKKIDEVDIVVGCLPQVITPEGLNIKNGSNIAHYYKKDNYESDFHPWGLGLIDNCLCQALEFVRERIVLSLSGRPGTDKIFEVFTKNGFSPNVLYQELIPQCEMTSLDSYVKVEKQNGCCFEFFTDSCGKDKISAAFAEKLRRGGKKIFHNIYIVEGILNGKSEHLDYGKKISL